VTPAEAARRARRYRLRLISNFLRAMDGWGGGTVAHILSARMQRKGAAEPPNPPPGPLAIRSGQLARTVRADRARYDGRLFRITLRAGGDGVDYGRIHEFGGLAGAGHRSLIPARPYMGPGVNDRLPELNKDLSRAADQARRDEKFGV